MVASTGLTRIRILIVTSVSAEKEAILRGLGELSEYMKVEAVGVGSIAAAAATAMLLSQQSYDLVISAGIGGGFAGRAEVGEIVLASEMVAADLGAETLDGFLSVEDLGFGQVRISVEEKWTEMWFRKLISAGIPAAYGPIITVNTATGTAASALELEQRVIGAAAEAMEGFGVGTAARLYGVPVIEIRGISNAVGPRDRSAWRIPDALEMLSQSFAVWKELHL